MTEKFDVLEIEIRNPKNKRVMERNLSEDDAEAYIKIAVMRRGVDTHFYKSVSAGTAG